MEFSRPAFLILAWLGALAAGVVVLWRSRRLSLLQAEATLRAAESIGALDESRRRIGELEQELARSRDSAASADARLRSLFEQVSVGLNHMTPEGRHLRVNQRFCAITGYSPDDLLHLRVQDITHPDDIACDQRNLARLLRGECASLTWEKRYVRKDGAVAWVSLTGSVMNSPAGVPQYVVGSVEDITARVHAREALRQSEERLHQLLRDRSQEERSEQERARREQRAYHSRKMESIGRLAGGIAREFNDHLTVIGGYCDMLLDELASDDPLCEEVGQIRAAASRAATLTHQLLTFSRGNPVERKPLDLNGVIREHCGVLGRLIGGRIEVISELSPNLGAVKAERRQLQQVLMNLTINARDAMPGGGKLIFQTAAADIAGSSDVPPGPYVMLTVSDTGAGMSPEVLSNIFEPFFTTKPVASGSGLGLSTVYGIVEQSEGFIRVTSQPGAGTTFRIYLPRIEGVIAPSPERRRRVLIIDDDASLRGDLGELLTAEGYEVHAAADREAGMSQIEGCQIGLVITDLLMAGRESLETMQLLRRRFPEVRIIALSGPFDAEFLKVASRLGADATFQKPIDPARLLPAVRTLLSETRV